MNEAAYREAEAELWASCGLHPAEQVIPLPRIGSRVRVQEIGDGDPVLFIHGGPNAGSTWAPMLPHFPGFRCLLVDRPGTGLSEPLPLGPDTVVEFAKRFVGDVLDGLGIDAAHVVASSLGGHLALRSAAAEPHRFRRMVQMACPALVPGDRLPPFMKLMRIGLVRRFLDLLPPNDRANRSILRQIGHGASLDAGRIPQGFFDWYLSLARHTDTMRNDGDMIGWLTRPGTMSRVRLTEELLATVKTPTLFIWGSDDSFGGEDVARIVVSAMPDAGLVMLPDSGHLPWLDFPQRAGELSAEFLGGDDR